MDRPLQDLMCAERAAQMREAIRWYPLAWVSRSCKVGELVRMEGSSWRVTVVIWARGRQTLVTLRHVGGETRSLPLAVREEGEGPWDERNLLSPYNSGPQGPDLHAREQRGRAKGWPRYHGT